MLRALRAWSAPTVRACSRSANMAVSSIAAIAATLMLASSAAAVPARRLPTHHPARRLPTHHPARVRSAGGRSLQTLVKGVRIFAAPSAHAAVRDRLGSIGTGVSVDCWTTGIYFGDNPIWYHISAPQLGYVAAFNMTAHFSPAASIPHCPMPTFRERFNSLAVNLRIRTSPSFTATIAGYLVSVGSAVTVDCFVTGSPVYKDATWYHALAPAVGYVTGRFLNTGGDPAPGVPRC